MALVNERFQVKLYPTALASDVLFYEVVDSVLPNQQDPVYGTPHPNRALWRYHKLVHIVNRREDGKQLRYYAANRENQDLYNWDIRQGSALYRSYLVLREKYYARSEEESENADPWIEHEFIHPVVASADSRFTRYGFADDEVLEAPNELKSLYIVVRRRYIKPVTVDFQFDESLDRSIAITKELIPTGSGRPPVSGPGFRVEIQDGNTFHDVQITREIVHDDDSSSSGNPYPYQLESLPSTYNRQFPSRLDKVDLVWRWAFADSENFQHSFSEDYYFDFKITDPRPGPYSATILRFITDDPESIKDAYPITIVPSPASDTIGVTGAWYFASNTEGNATSAIAKEVSIPATIHDGITVNFEEDVDSAAPPVPSEAQAIYRQTIDETPGYTAFMTAISTGPITVDYDVREAPLGLFEVSVIRIDASDLYPAIPEDSGP